MIFHLHQVGLGSVALCQWWLWKLDAKLYEIIIRFVFLKEKIKMLSEVQKLLNKYMADISKYRDLEVFFYIWYYE